MIAALVFGPSWPSAPPGGKPAFSNAFCASRTRGLATFTAATWVSVVAGLVAVAVVAAPAGTAVPISTAAVAAAAIVVRHKFQFMIFLVFLGALRMGAGYRVL